jgi:hypothetical protein
MDYPNSKAGKIVRYIGFKSLFSPIDVSVDLV